MLSSFKKAVAISMLSIFASSCNSESHEVDQLNKISRSKIENLALSFWEDYEDASGTYLVKDKDNNEYYAIILSDNLDRDSRHHNNLQMIERIDSTQIDSAVLKHLKNFTDIAGDQDDRFVVRKTDLVKIQQYGHPAFETGFGYIFMYDPAQSTPESTGHNGTISKLEDVSVTLDKADVPGIFLVK